MSTIDFPESGQKSEIISSPFKGIIFLLIHLKFNGTFTSYNLFHLPDFPSFPLFPVTSPQYEKNEFISTCVVHILIGTWSDS